MTGEFSWNIQRPLPIPKVNTVLLAADLTQKQPKAPGNPHEPQRQLMSGRRSVHFSFTNFFKEHTSILLNNYFWIWLREQEQQLKACPL